MTKGFIADDMQKHYRIMVIDLNDYLDLLPLESDRKKAMDLLRLKRKFTVAEGEIIASLHYNLREQVKKKGLEDGDKQI